MEDESLYVKVKTLDEEIVILKIVLKLLKEDNDITAIITSKGLCKLIKAYLNLINQ